MSYVCKHCGHLCVKRGPAHVCPDGVRVMNMQYKDALREALELLALADLEPTSALKQAAHDNGIAYGKAMSKFVKWAKSKLR